MSSGELRRGFHDDLAELQIKVERMLAVVVEGIGGVTTALLESDRAAAAAVMATDAVIDELYPTVESDIFQLVARQAPVARDLRFLMATMRVAMAIERCGDLMASIGRRVSTVDPAALTPPVRILVADIGARTSSLYRAAAGAYSVLDAEQARSLPEEDDAIDALQLRLFDELHRSAPDLVASAVELGLVARFYERIADHAVVIAERILFVVDGSMNASDADEQGWRA